MNNDQIKKLREIQSNLSEIALDHQTSTDAYDILMRAKDLIDDAIGSEGKWLKRRL